MTLMNRMLRLFKADLHGLLDCVEEPQAVLKQAIRDMEHELKQQEQSLLELQSEVARAAAQCSERSQKLAQIDAQIDLCFDTDNESLARRLVRRKLEARQRLLQTELARTELAERKARLEQQIEEQRERLDDVVAKAELFSSTEPAAACTDPLGGISDEDVEVAFLHEKQRRGARPEEGSRP